MYKGLNNSSIYGMTIVTSPGNHSILLSERFLFGFQSVSKCPQVSFSATKAVYNDLLKKVFSHNSSDSQDDKTIANQMKLSAAKLRSLFLVPRTKVNLGLFC